MAAPRRPTRRAAVPLPLEAQKFEIDCILEERRTQGRAKAWVLVRWVGYHPQWEAWRIRGEIGSALETWEPRFRVARTDAYKAWLERETETETLHLL